MSSGLHAFYQGKTVLVTGHTGFKGAWLCEILSLLGARVVGYSLNPPTHPSLYDLIDLKSKLFASVIGDIRDLKHLRQVFEQYKPDVVFHLAAQPLVRESYKDPVTTYETNVIGTVNVLEAIRFSESVVSVINITTDKVYKNNEWCWGYRECDMLDGFDPYSNSKSCSELVTSSYKKSFFSNRNIAISTCRAGNVIGGGDFSADRIVPDCVRAVEAKESISVRNRHSIRPYQHVLEPLFAYLLLAKEQTTNHNLAGAYNIGPDERDCVTTGELVDIFCQLWGEGASWVDRTQIDAPHEAGILKLDCSKIKSNLSWKPVWGIREAVGRTVDWTKAYHRKEDLVSVMKQQISDYISYFQTED